MIKKAGICALIIGIYSVSYLVNPIPQAEANTLRDVIISEVAWAGSSDSASDEWIELYNNTANQIDLTGWSIEDDGSTQVYELEGNIGAHSYYLIENREIATSVTADLIHTLSLSNAGDSLVLKNIIGTTIDSVNSSSGAWPAGNNTAHASMERINFTEDGNTAANWRTSTINTVATASNGGAVLGSPRAASTAQTPPNTSTNISITADKSAVQSSEEVTMTIAIENASNVSNWGIDLIYDREKLRYVRSTEGTFLSENSSIETSFQSALQGGVEGTVVVANARTISPLTGTSGNGNLFQITLQALETISTGSTSIHLASSSFLSTPTSRITMSEWPALSISTTGTPTIIDPISNLTITPGNDRYHLVLEWTASPTAKVQYDIYRSDPHGEYQMLGSTAATTFTDGDNIIPQLTYSYQVVARASTQASPATTATGKELRGLKGDNNRSDRVDGGDLEAIARAWSIDDTQSEFAPLVDTSFDGIINGSDLIDLAISWAHIYP